MEQNTEFGISKAVFKKIRRCLYHCDPSNKFELRNPPSIKTKHPTCHPPIVLVIIHVRFQIITITYIKMTENFESLADACMSGSIDKVMGILEKSPQACQTELKWTDSDGKELSSPPIFIAIDYGHLELVQNMLPLHKDIIDSLKDSDGDYTAVSWASFTGNLKIVNLLIQEGGAKVEDEALSLAREYDHKEVADLLLKHVDLYSGLEGDLDAMMDKACREGDVAKVRKLLEEENYDVEKWKDEEGKYLGLSPMDMAVKFGHYDLIQLFAEKGIQVDIAAD
jgi:ankyrin repeat protein